MSNQLTLWELLGPTSLPALADGIMPLPSPAGPSTVPSGRHRSPASPSVRPDALKAWATSGTYGLLFCGSSPSADLQQLLASKLEPLLDVHGSPEYVLTWKHWDMLSGPPISALRASPRPTNASACTGWRTPTATERSGGSQIGLMKQVRLAGWRTPDHCERGGEYRNPQKALDRVNSGHQVNLSDQVVLAGWVSPMAQDGTRGVQPPRPQDTGIPLSQQVVGWGTPSTRDWKDAGPAFEANPDMVAAASRLPRQVHGTTTPSSSAETGKVGVLNQNFSCWLMGYPIEWIRMAPKKGEMKKGK